MLPFFFALIQCFLKCSPYLLLYITSLLCSKIWMYFVVLILPSYFRCCHGKGCQRSYHLSCLEPPFQEFPLGVWYCLACVRKKIESGVHSVSDGIEEIWDSRELEASEDGMGTINNLLILVYMFL